MRCPSATLWILACLALPAAAQDTACLCQQPPAPPGRALTVVVDLNAADLGRPLQPRHEVAFQLQARPPAQVKPAALGGTVRVYRHQANGREQLAATLTAGPEAANPQAAKATGYLYRQLFIWPKW